MTLSTVNDSGIEKVPCCEEVATINYFIMNEYDYPNTDGQLKLFVPDTGDVGHGNDDPEFKKRKTTHRFKVILPLDYVFGFFSTKRVSLSTIYLVLELHRNFMSENVANH